MKTLIDAFPGFAIAVLGFLLLGGLAASGQTISTGKWWYSSDPSRVSVDANGAMKAVYPGMTQVCSQPSKTVVNPTQCFTVIVTQVVK